MRVLDRGQTYDVVVQSVRGRVERSFDDEQRDCERRVRFAAVFAVVTLLPPDIIGEDEPAPPQPEPERIPPPAEPEPPPPQIEPALVRLEAGVFAELAPRLGSNLGSHGLGGELRGALGRGPLSVLIAIGYAPAQRFRSSRIEGDVTRIPAALGVRLGLLHEPIVLALDGALALALERFGDADLRFASSATIVEAGARLGLMASWPSDARLAPFVALTTTVFPAPREVEIAPAGVVARTAPLWLAATLGAALAL